MALMLAGARAVMYNHKQDNVYKSMKYPKLCRTSHAEAGDTIVEVIIAVVVVATILAGAFTVTNRNTRAVRDSEEHAQALQVLQGQVELLRAAASIPGSLPATLSTPFCLGAGLQNYAAGSTSCAGGNGTVHYDLSIVCSPASAGCPAPSGTTTTFDLKASWSALGGGTDTVYLSYKVEVAP